MAAPTVQPVPQPLFAERSLHAAAMLGEILSLASTLAARWEEFDVESRRRAAERLSAAVDGIAALVDERSQAEACYESFPPLDWLPRLTPREFDVLCALAGGRTTSAIAVALGISTATVRSHVKSLLSKLGVHTRVEAVALFHAHIPDGFAAGD